MTKLQQNYSKCVTLTMWSLWSYPLQPHQSLLQKFMLARVNGIIKADGISWNTTNSEINFEQFNFY